VVREVGAAAGAILELAEHLAGEGIEKVTLGAASDYWGSGRHDCSNIL
jgi:hypothetical protein